MQSSLDAAAIHDSLSAYKDERTTLLNWGLIPIDEIESVVREINDTKMKFGLEEYSAEVQRQMNECMASFN